MTFVVNGADWCFDGMLAKDVEKIIGDFLEFVDLSKDRDEAVEIGDDFQYRPMREAQTLWDMFAKNTDESLSGELRQEMAAWLVSVKYYADAADWPDGAENTVISIGASPPVENSDAAWAHHCIRAGRAVACIALSNTLVFETTTTTRTDSGDAALHFVRDEDGRRAFWRGRIPIEGDNEASLARLAPHAYPNIHFVDGVLDDMNKLAGGYLASKEKIQAAFASLNDWGCWVFTCPPPAMTPSEKVVDNSGGEPSNQLIEKRFSGLGMTAAPEKPNVKKDTACRKARETNLGGRVLYCSWHVKLEPHQNRIHIHKPVEESNRKVVVGMIAKHLPLP